MSAAPSKSPLPIAQAAAVPFRNRRGATEVCLITSLHKGKWVLPKGIIDPGETPAQTALKECLEEAGLHGRIVVSPLGRYDDFKWGTTLEVEVFLVEVQRAEATWPECDVRRRGWFTPAEAAQQVSKPGAKELLRKAVRRLGKDAATDDHG